MAKSREKNKALELRQKGESIKEIARKLKIAKSTISLWCRDIELTPEQIKELHAKMVRGGYKGRLMGARAQFERRLRRTKELEQQGGERIKSISPRDIMIAGTALYWGEGQKKGREVRICNSDPEIIKFMLRWFRDVLGVKDNEITFFIIINEIHKNRVKKVEEFWSKTTQFPKEKFTKTTLIKAKNKKNYKNFPTHYGTITIRLKNPTRLHHQIMGMIKGLSSAA